MSNTLHRARQCVLFVLLVALSIINYPLSIRAQGITTALLTVTNQATNGFSIQINGQYRQFTNVGYYSNAYNQIVLDTNGSGGTIGGTMSNTFLAFAQYPQPGMAFYIPNILKTNLFTNSPNVYTNYLYVPATNQIVFQSFNGQPMVVVLGGGGGSNWATVTYSTYNTNLYTPLVVPPAGLGPDDLTNMLSGLTAWLNESTNVGGAVPIISTNYIWSNFVNATALNNLSNYVTLQGTNLTNLTLTFGTNSSNYTQFYDQTSGTNITNYVNYFSNIYWLALTWTTNNFGSLLNNVNYHDLGNLTSFGTNTILLTNEGSGGSGTWRMVAQPGPSPGNFGGEFVLYTSDQSPWISLDTTGNTFIQDRTTTKRLEIGNSSAYSGSQVTILRGINGNSNLSFGIGSDSTQIYKPITFNTASTMPAVALGTLTNFFDQEQNSGTGATTVDSITIPANMLTNNGDSLTREITVSLPTTGSSRRIEVSFAAAGDIVDTGSGGFTLAGGGAAKVSLTITRSGANAYNWSSSVFIQGPTSPFFQVSANSVSSFNSGSGWSAPSVFPIVLTTASVGGLTGDLIIATDSVKFQPASQWAYLQ